MDNKKSTHQTRALQRASKRYADMVPSTDRPTGKRLPDIHALTCAVCGVEIEYLWLCGICRIDNLRKK